MATLQDKFTEGQTLKFKTSVRVQSTIKDGKKVWEEPTEIHFIVSLDGITIERVLRQGKDLVVKFVNNKIRPKYDGDQAKLQAWADEHATVDNPFQISFEDIFKSDRRRSNAVPKNPQEMAELIRRMFPDKSAEEIQKFLLQESDS